ncbi:YeaH/YhbH family protein [Hirschia baltica]|uniref:UPF0229 protein Hbal_1360 n=1 Tax=Hirschia baltica (strain ATCC 49814 / DSM 5838 / IFAM 1418) TaxID=582402 RepID=C6XIV7_HIRBI|nr:YeaH/YhbH family protein [Hirschia baltica]ACT59052.1 protein of unknown function DUF444 [Hirschia baltica ATCC 49814]
MHIIDRRREGGKSLTNRQRFLKRSKALVKKAVKDASSGRSIKDAGKGGDIIIPADGVHEPSLRKGREGGRRERVMPGNKEFLEGDRIERPEDGQGRGNKASDSGEGEDDYTFNLSSEEFMELFLEDLELPDLAKRQVMGVEDVIPERAGFQSAGSPSAIAIGRTMRNSMSRRVALRRPRDEEIEAAQSAIAKLITDEAPAAKIKTAEEKLATLNRRRKFIPFIDPLDVKYRRFEGVPQPVARAVMFCLMDVSGSMDDHMKDLAKRFYSLLYLFLKTRYSRVEVVFIRHTHEAKEVDEQTFFYSRESGGTIVSTALDQMFDIIRERYPADQWNIYAAQASDGDNLPSDNLKTITMLQDTILPLCQYYAYLEVGNEDQQRFRMSGDDETGLWRAYHHLVESGGAVEMRKVKHRREIFPVFAELFKKRETAKASA